MATTALEQAKLLILQGVREKFSDELDLTEGTPQYDFFVRIFDALVEQIMTVLLGFEARRSTVDPSALGTTEYDNATALHFLPRDAGYKSQGSATVLLRAALPFKLDANAPAVINGQSYLVKTSVDKLASELTAIPQTGKFTTSIDLIATSVGRDFNVGVNAPVSIAVLSGNSNVERVYVSSPLAGGRGLETNAENLARIRRTQGVRVPVHERGIDAVLTERFPGLIQKLLVVGMTDPEMRRDLIRAVVGGNGTSYASLAELAVDAVLTAADNTAAAEAIVALVKDEIGQIMRIHVGGHTDVYAQTPVLRQDVILTVPEGDPLIDLSDYLAILKLHKVTVVGDPERQVAARLTNIDPALRFSALDPVQIFVDPALRGQQIIADLSYAPDIPTLHAFLTDEQLRVKNGNYLVRFFNPVWLFSAIYVSDGDPAAIASAIQNYLSEVNSQYPTQLPVASKLTEAMHKGLTVSVNQDYTLYGSFEVNGVEQTIDTEEELVIPEYPELGFTQRTIVFLNEAITAFIR